MDKIELQTNKFYYGFPVIIIGYKDSKFGYNITTNSSSYSLGNMLVIATAGGSNLANNIKKYMEFSVNIPTEELMYEIEGAGFISGDNKLSKLKLSYDISETIDAPLLKNTPINIECKVEKIVEIDGYLNIISKVTRRLVSENLINENLNFNNEKFYPVFFLGDASKRVYRYLDKNIENVKNKGEFINEKGYK